MMPFSLIDLNLLPQVREHVINFLPLSVLFLNSDLVNEIVFFLQTGQITLIRAARLPLLNGPFAEVLRAEGKGIAINRIPIRFVLQCQYDGFYNRLSIFQDNLDNLSLLHRNTGLCP